MTYPYRMDYTIRAILPDRRNVSSEKWEIKRAAYEIKFSSKYIATENVWELHYEYVTLKDYVEVAEVGQFRKDINKLAENLEYELIGDGNEDINANEDLNIPVILISLLVLGFIIFCCLKFYQYSPLEGLGYFSGINIGGWLWVLGFGLILNSVRLLSAYLNNTDAIYHSGAGWNAMSGQSDFKIASFHFLLVIETHINLFLAAFAILLVVLFVQKRDSFPLLFSFFAGGNLVFIVIDTLVSYIIFGSDDAATTIVGNIVKQVLYASIWIPYVNNSDRVRRTFVNSYKKQHAKLPNADAEVI